MARKGNTAARKVKCAECGKMRTTGGACEHCGVCPECGSTDDEPPTYDCHICDREGTNDEEEDEEDDEDE